MYIIREFDDKDAETVSKIISEAFKEEILRGMPKPTSEKVIQYSKRTGVKVFVCETWQRAVVGFLNMTEENTENPAQIHLIGVKHEYRQKGIGKALVKKAIEHAKNLGTNKIRVFVRPWNVSMCRLCEELKLTQEAYLRREFLNEDLIQYSVILNT